MITTEQVKALRDETSVSIMQCRKALEEANGDMAQARLILQRKGGEIAAKKSDREAADGIIVAKSEGGRGIILTLHCETDFVAKNEDFIGLAHTLVQHVWEKGIEETRSAAPALISDVVLKVGENIQLGTIEEITGDAVSTYVHHTGKVAASVALTGGTEDVAKDIAMHVAAMRPAYLKAEDISDEQKAGVIALMEKEVAESDKPEDIKAKMLEGKIAGFFKEQTLIDQPFFKAPEKTIGTYAKEHGASVQSFALYTI